MGKKILFAIIPLIFTIGIVTALPLVNADYMDNINREDIDVQCRDGLVLVLRYTSNEYVCTDNGNAGRWIQLGIAELANPARTWARIEASSDNSGIYACVAHDVNSST